MPLREQRDLPLVETAVVEESGIVLVRMPRRHRALGGDLSELLRALFRVRVGQQRKRRDLSGPMAARAFCEKNRRDVLVKSDVFGQRFGGGTGGGEQEQDGGDFH